MKKILFFIILVFGFIGMRGQTMITAFDAPVMLLNLNERDSDTVVVISNDTVYWAIITGGASLWSQNGSDIYYSSGDVGINTSTPGKDLDVQGDVNISDTLETGFIQAGGDLGMSSGQQDDFPLIVDGPMCIQSYDNSLGTYGGGIWEIDQTTNPVKLLWQEYKVGYGTSVFLGQSAGYSPSTYSGNGQMAGVGYLALGGSTGVGETALGWSAGYQTSGQNNIYLGNFPGYGCSGDNNFIAGFRAGGYSGAHLSDDGNIMIGNSAGYSSTSAQYNVMIGQTAGEDNTTGDKNIFLGYSAGGSNTSGGNNIFAGFHAGGRNTTAYNNIAGGWYALYNNETGAGNVAWGQRAGYNWEGDYGLFLGYRAGADDAGTGGPVMYLAWNEDDGLLNDTWLHGDSDGYVYAPYGRLYLTNSTSGSLVSDESGQLELTANDGLKITKHSGTEANIYIDPLPPAVSSAADTCFLVLNGVSEKMSYWGYQDLLDEFSSDLGYGAEATASTLSIDSIYEETVDNGVYIEGTLLKDNTLTVSNRVDFDGIIEDVTPDRNLVQNSDGQVEYSEAAYMSWSDNHASSFTLLQSTWTKIPLTDGTYANYITAKNITMTDDSTATVSVAGIFRITFTVTLNIGSDIDVLRLQPRVNGSGYGGACITMIEVESGRKELAFIDLTVELSSGDEITLYAYQANVSSVSVSIPVTTVSIHKLY